MPRADYHSLKTLQKALPASALFWGSVGCKQLSDLCLVFFTTWCWCCVRGWATWDPVSHGTGAPISQPSPAQGSSCCPHGAKCTGPGRQHGSRLQISSRSQAPSLLSKESIRAGGCETSRPLLANTKLIKYSINQPLINNFTSKTVVVQSLVFESPLQCPARGIKCYHCVSGILQSARGVCGSCLFVWWGFSVRNGRDPTHTCKRKRLWGDRDWCCGTNLQKVSWACSHIYFCIFSSVQSSQALISDTWMPHI